jgi:adenosylcobinamide kinase/adenosylcobinamide-phosphate guanylyltransferase
MSSTSLHPLLLVLGGARSGKSSYALRRASTSGLRPVFIATAQAFDIEMEDRIARHRMERGAEWVNFEVPVALAETVAAEAASDRILLIDCLTLWTSNLMLDGHSMEAAFKAFLATLKGAGGPIILVSNEVGLGIVPDNKLAREFRDHAGRLNQLAAEAATEVQFVTAGLPLRLK